MSLQYIFLNIVRLYGLCYLSVSFLQRRSDDSESGRAPGPPSPSHAIGTRARWDWKPGVVFLYLCFLDTAFFMSVVLF